MSQSSPDMSSKTTKSQHGEISTEWLQVRCCSERNASPLGSLGETDSRARLKVEFELPTSSEVSSKVAGCFCKTSGTLIASEINLPLVSPMMLLVEASRLREDIYVAVIIILGLCSGRLATNICNSTMVTTWSNSLKNV